MLSGDKCVIGVLCLHRKRPIMAVVRRCLQGSVGFLFEVVLDDWCEAINQKCMNG